MAVGSLRAPLSQWQWERCSDVALGYCAKHFPPALDGAAMGRALTDGQARALSVEVIWSRRWELDAFCRRAPIRVRVEADTLALTRLNNSIYI
jgi:hypothetical protein